MLLATIFPIAPGSPIKVSQFIPDEKPGNVAVCLSGGGSRALTAGMGQLNALQSLPYSTGQSLLSQTKALSTVSGGSWIGVPFVYLPSWISDTDYLGGPYIEPGNLTPQSLSTLPADCMAVNITSNFTLLDIAIQMMSLTTRACHPTCCGKRSSGCTC